MIDIIDLKKSFDGLEVLKGINLHVDKGDVICVIGPSGSGKSTLLRCVNCLEDPDSGQIIFNGTDIADMKVDINLVRRKMCMVFQHFNLFNNMTVLENITFAPIQAALSDARKAHCLNRATRDAIKENAVQKAMALLERIDLAEFKDAYPSTLSGGQKQRVSIVRAMAMDPDVILFDEPTSALDPEMVGEVLDLIRDLAQSGITMLIVTHEMGFAREVASKVAFIDEGVIKEIAPPGELFGNPQNERLKEFLSKVL